LGLALDNLSGGSFKSLREKKPKTQDNPALSGIFSVAFLGLWQGSVNNNMIPI
jgi:hypothetical protein